MPHIDSYTPHFFGFLWKPYLGIYGELCPQIGLNRKPTLSTLKMVCTIFCPILCQNGDFWPPSGHFWPFGPQGPKGHFVVKMSKITKNIKRWCFGMVSGPLCIISIAELIGKKSHLIWKCAPKVMRNPFLALYGPFWGVLLEVC